MQPMKDKILRIPIVNFYEVDAGWIFFSISFGDEPFESRFSEVFDPLLDFKHWLEAIALGVQQTSFIYDTEGSEIKFDFERISWDTDIFTVTELYDNEEPSIKEEVSRRELVRAFYEAFLSIANSDTFDARQWEIEYITERLCNVLRLDELTLIEKLAELNRVRLAKYIYKVTETFDIPFPTEKDINERQFLDEKDSEYVIPDDFDNWSIETKKEFIKECLYDYTSGYTGTKLAEFRSKIIAEYLSEE